jgi:ATP-binding cassette, subfamily B, multidrug efflux pump
MLERIYKWFESRIDPFERPANRPIPNTLPQFYWHFVEPVWPVFLLLLLVGLAGSLIEVGLMGFVGRLVDMMRATPDPKTFIGDHIWLLLSMAFVALLLRPVVSTLHDLIKNQMITAAFTTRIRWQTHGHVLRQSLSFFQMPCGTRLCTFSAPSPCSRRLTGG